MRQPAGHPIRYLRNKKDGFIYEWDPILAKHPLCEEVSEQEAYPERFASKEVTDRTLRRLAERNVKSVTLNLEEFEEEGPPPIEPNPLMGLDSSRRIVV